MQDAIADGSRDAHQDDLERFHDGSARNCLLASAAFSGENNRLDLL